MEKKKMTLPVKLSDLDQAENLAAFFRLVGHVEAFHSIELLSRATRLKKLKLIRDEKLYKSMGLTMRDVFNKLGIAKTTGYQELEALEKFGGELMDVFYEMDMATNDMYLMVKGIENVEGAEFEIVDVEKGQIKVGGRMLSAKQDTEAVTAAIQKLLGALKRERLVVKGLEKNVEGKNAELKARDTEIERRDAKIAEGEKQLKRAKKHLPGETDIGNALFQVAQFVKQILIMEEDEEDKARRDLYLQRITNTITGPLVAKFKPTGEDLFLAKAMMGNNEFEQQAGEEA